MKKLTSQQSCSLSSEISAKRVVIGAAQINTINWDPAKGDVADWLKDRDFALLEKRAKKGGAGTEGRERRHSNKRFANFTVCFAFRRQAKPSEAPRSFKACPTICKELWDH